MDLKRFYVGFTTASAVVITATLLTGCASLHSELVSDSKLIAIGTGTPVLASAETVAVGTAGLDAADDPEIWVDPMDKSRSLILGTDKKAGLYAYNLDGSVRDFVAHGPLNNVDLRTIYGETGSFTLIAASDRARNGAALFTLTDDLKLKVAGFLPMTTSEAYGLCMGTIEAGITIVIIGKNGDVVQAIYSETEAGPRGEIVRRFNVGTQSEGCVIDDRTGALYIAEEAKGIWRYGVEPATGSTRVELQAAPSNILVPDVEGLALLVDEDSGLSYLIASSQGDSAFAVWQVAGETSIYKGRFSVFPGNGFDAVTGTDGVAALGGQVGPYAEGVVVMQDDSDMEGETPTGARARQNFKIVPWMDVKKALNIGS
ncbi:phytase [Asticcacaulis sp. AC402]|uniref:phytase n=1 Tax=Asticcacaulis sp. AC402 TaxID=1282361 RepID=UPI0003C3BAD8|nr:phytase [Asticcacaulis sp. AC402]ESQ74758.1 3-phytase [Asticcacaulis sp. AC402]